MRVVIAARHVHVFCRIVGKAQWHAVQMIAVQFRCLSDGVAAAQGGGQPHRRQAT